MTTILFHRRRLSGRRRPIVVESERKAPARDQDVALEQLRERVRKLLATEIAFIPHASFARQKLDEGEEALDASTRSLSLRTRTLLDQLGAAPLLTAEQEHNCFRRMNWLKYRANVLRSKFDPHEPDAESVDEVERLLRQAQAVRNRIVCANMRLVMAIVKRFATPHDSFDELLSEGVVTLFKAVEKFDFARGFRFSTYGYRAISTNTFRSIKTRAERRAKFVSLPESRCELPDAREITADVDRATLLVALRELLTSLTPRERFVVSARFALETRQEPRTFQSLADELGVSKERVRQVEQHALNKLHAVAVEMGLEEFVEP